MAKQLKTIKVNQLLNYVQGQLGRPYWYGGIGEYATEDLYNKLSKRYPKYYDATKYKKGWKEDYGKKVHDCIGLVKAAVWCDGDSDGKPTGYNATQDLSANGTYEKCVEKGPISSLPEIPGLLVWKNGHIGVYMGHGQVIEARGHDYGVVKTVLSQRPWTNWCKYPWVDYSQPNTVNVTVIVNGKTYNGNIEEV